MKTLVYLVVFINILFSIFCFIIGFNFAHLFIITTLGFLQGSNSLLGNIGVPLLTGGFLVVALPMLLLGGFYAYISFKLIKTKDIRWLYSVFYL